MKIKEATLATGLTERAIRLYEEHGLISPSVTVKNGRDFRDYTEENITRLKTIAALRRALFTIDEYMSVQGNASYRSSFYVSEKGCYLNSSDRKDAVLIDSDFAYNSAGELCSVKVIGSFDADFNLTCAAVIIYPQISNSPRSFGGINSARVIVVSVSSDDASDAQELLSTYASSH